MLKKVWDHVCANKEEYIGVTAWLTLIFLFGKAQYGRGFKDGITSDYF